MRVEFTFILLWSLVSCELAIPIFRRNAVSAENKWLQYSNDLNHSKAKFAGVVDKMKSIQRFDQLRDSKAVAASSSSIKSTSATSMVISTTSSPSKASSTSSKPSAPSTTAQKTSRIVTAALPLTDQAQGVLWTAQIGIGNQQYSCDPDTGSADIWVPSINSTSSHTRYKQSKTGVFVPNCDYEVYYSDGSGISGNCWKEMMSLGPLRVNNQIFSAATSISDYIDSTPGDGLVGLAFPSLSTLPGPTLLESLVQQKIIVNATFSFKLSVARTGSELYFGGLNPKLYVAGSTFWTPVVYRSYWNIAGVISASGPRSRTNFSVLMIIDTGTSLVIGPPNEVAALYATIVGSFPLPDEPGFYGFPCNANYNINFKFGSRTVPWSKQWFNLGQYENDPSICVGAVSVGNDGDPWLIGDAFLRGSYVSFDVTGGRVGFSTLK